MSHLRLSDTHGANPSLQQCFVCGKDVGVVLFGRLKGDAEAPRRVCLPGSEPCAECQGWMEKGIVLISVDEARSTDPNNPYRSGGWAVVTEVAISRWLEPGELLDQILRKRMAFLPDPTWDQLGLPRGEKV